MNPGLNCRNTTVDRTRTLPIHTPLNLQLVAVMASVRGVHFSADVDWTEEESRSRRGAEARRKKKQARKMAKDQKEERLQAAFEILQDAQYAEDLVTICNHRITRSVVYGVIRQDEDVATADYRRGLRDALRAFRATGATRNALTRDEVEALDILSGLNRFLAKFRDYMPATVISSEEEGSGGQQSRAQQDS